MNILRVVYVLPLLLPLACTGRERLAGPTTAPEVWVEVSSLRALPGERVALGVRIAGDAPSLAGVQGTLRYDATSLRYAGQSPEPGRLVLVNDSRAGALRFIALDVSGTRLPVRPASFVFDVIRPGFAPSVMLDIDLAATSDLAAIERVRSGPSRLAEDLPVPAGARRMTLEDWHAVLASPDGHDQQLSRVPGQYVPGLRYGDASLNGVVNILDAANTANLAVGNLPLLTDATKDYVIAANVHPANAPGLGEDGDVVPPGQDAGGGFSINVLDAAVISNEAVGNDQPVAGEPIPGREPRPAARAVLSGVLTADRTLFRDTIYELQGLVIVQGGVTLTVQSGTTVEGDEATRGALAIYRGANISARGTRLQPIVFTCDAPVKSRGCWGGLVINGFSLLNNGEILPGGVDVNGCPQKVYPTTPGYAGGCLVQDSSGMLRYVRIEYAGMAPAGQGPVPGLALLGLGSGTVVDSVQVHASLGDGLFVGGGTVDVRGVVLTDNAADGLRWEDGWVGRGQFIVVQQTADNDHALHGINWPFSPSAGPRSNPFLSHVTISGPPGGLGATANGLLFEHGSAGSLWNVVVLRAGVAGLEIQGAESCMQAAGAMPGLHVAASIFFASPADFSADADCVDESAWALDPSRANRVLDPLLVAPFNTLTPDLRPLPASPATTGYMQPPANGFFDLTAAFVGAVAPANGTGSNIPWYAGWTRGW